MLLTNLEGRSQSLYDDIYCARGEMENRIKEQQLGLFSDRTSCHAWWANQFRLLLSSAVYLLLEALRRIGLKGSQLARAQVGTIRLRLLKIGAIITRNTRRIRLWLSSRFPLQELFHCCLRRFPDGALAGADPGHHKNNGGVPGVSPDAALAASDSPLFYKVPTTSSNRRSFFRANHHIMQKAG